MRLPQCFAYPLVFGYEHPLDRVVIGFPIVKAKFTLLRNYALFHNEF